MSIVISPSAGKAKHDGEESQRIKSIKLQLYDTHTAVAWQIQDITSQMKCVNAGQRPPKLQQAETSGWGLLQMLGAIMISGRMRLSSTYPAVSLRALRNRMLFTR